MKNNDLISRSALLEEFEWLKDNTGAYNHAALDDHIQRIKNAPAVDAEPVRHGRYGFVGMDMMAGTRAFYFGTCSVCRERINFESKHKNYCPNCGAKMDGDVNAD